MAVAIGFKAQGLQFGLDAVVEENSGLRRNTLFPRPASIRPRRCRRGEPGLGRRVSRHTGRLQFGLDAVVEENPDRGAGELQVRPASIRPRRCRRGERPQPGRHLDAGRQASIRPRRCRRGEPRLNDQRQPPAHRFNSASTLSSRRTLMASRLSSPLAELQFGLDAVVEENLPVRMMVGAGIVASIRPRRCRRGEPLSGEVAICPDVSGFNSASTLSSRRTSDGREFCDRTARLQFGLDAVVEENAMARSRPRMRMVLQFGLDAVVEENGSAAGVRAGRSAGFNSASTLSSRRTTERQANKAAAAALQFGLDAVVEENPSPWAKLNRP